MRRLIDVINNQDNRYILKEEVFSEDEPREWLVPIMNNIFKEYEKLKKDNFYQKHLEKQEYVLYERYKIVALRTLFESLILRDKESAEIINTNFKFKFDLNNKNIYDLIIQQMKSIDNHLYIMSIKEREKTIEKILWEEKITYIHQVLKIQIDYNTTVTQYLSYENAAKRIISAQ